MCVTSAISYFLIFFLDDSNLFSSLLVSREQPLCVMLKSALYACFYSPCGQIERMLASMPRPLLLGVAMIHATHNSFHNFTSLTCF